MSWRWYPHVASPRHELEAIQVSWSDIMAADERYDLITDYGNLCRTGTAPRP